MEADARRITRHMKQYYDRDLVAKVDREKICIFRKNKKWTLYSFCGVEFSYPHSVLDYVFALTDNWSLNGKPTMWGIDHIFNRLKEVDIRDNPRLFEEIEKANEAEQAKVEKRRSNDIKAYCADIRRDFAKVMDGINTSTLEKIDKRRIKDGYSKQRP